jgi:pimeloyl-ACP methyl ester carboxylesterase
MELWHEIAGEGSPVTLIHPGVCDSRVWDPQWGTFPFDHRTIRCDLRGFGRTPIPAEPYSHAKDVIELLEHLTSERARLSVRRSAVVLPLRSR